MGCIKLPAQVVFRVNREERSLKGARDARAKKFANRYFLALLAPLRPLRFLRMRLGLGPKRSLPGFYSPGEFALLVAGEYIQATRPALVVRAPDLGEEFGACDGVDILLEVVLFNAGEALLALGPFGGIREL